MFLKEPKILNVHCSPPLNSTAVFSVLCFLAYNFIHPIVILPFLKRNTNSIEWTILTETVECDKVEMSSQVTNRENFFLTKSWKAEFLSSNHTMIRASLSQQCEVFNERSVKNIYI